MSIDHTSYSQPESDSGSLDGNHQRDDYNGSRQCENNAFGLHESDGGYAIAPLVSQSWPTRLNAPSKPKSRWIHIASGIFGNFTFFIGSIFFLWESLQQLGVWLFIVGSLCMLMSSIGNAVMTYQQEKAPRSKSVRSSRSSASCRNKFR